MQKISKFEKVSLSRFSADLVSLFPELKSEAERIYNAVVLPERATAGSAGYDFRSPVSFSLEPGKTVTIPTGIRAKMENGWVLALFPRSGLGFKYRLQLNNTVGIIDSDYYFSENEGHIFIKLTNDSNENKTVNIGSGDGFAQGIFLPFGITEDDNSSALRNGGFGSTDKK